MKLIQHLNENDLSLSRSYIEIENNETVLHNKLFSNYKSKFGELYIPEGIEKIAKYTFYGDFNYHTFYFPKSLL